MGNIKPSSRSKIVRGSKRAHYDKKTLYKVLDAGFLCHVSYLFNGSPVIIPTSYAREGNMLFIHGAKKNRMMNSVLEQGQACVAVTHLDGMVLARSAFNHSFNYRSAVIFGTPVRIEDEKEKERALKLITENIMPGRWREVRTPSTKEIRATQVIGIEIDEASVKMRSGGPVDSEADYDLPIWAGVLPTKQMFLDPIADKKLSQGIEIPKSIKNVFRNK
jgi:nitroimidazol reductase NimA-like FMN-containing flavoprotein (pyridoxamine 5'-phosphate oxidase superfamily)